MAYYKRCGYGIGHLNLWDDFNRQRQKSNLLIQTNPIHLKPRL